MTRASAREILRLAGPALPVLAAEPLYLLVDTAVVGRLGAVPLAGLSVAAVLFAQVTSQLNFLSYGTTARAARLFGSGRRVAAVAEGTQATWLALAVGVVVLAVGQVVARPVADALGNGGAIADAAVSWLRIALFGAPLLLATLAGNGWMRGVQDTGRPLRYVLTGNGVSALACPLLVHGGDLLGGWAGLGLLGSAWANLAGQCVGASLFLRALVRETASMAGPASDPGALMAGSASDPAALMAGPASDPAAGSWRPRPAVLRAQLSMGRDLLTRGLAFQACFLSAAAVATRFGAPAAAAHQIVLQLWTFMAMVLDAVAIAAQSLVGAALGAGAVDRARALATRVVGYGLVLGVGFGVVSAALSRAAPPVFTSDAAVLAALPVAWWIFTALQPVAGVVFAIDGVLLGAGDAAFLRTATLLAALAGFLPLIWAALAFGWGLAGLWTGLAAFMLVRLVTVGLRVRGTRWTAPVSGMD